MKIKGNILALLISVIVCIAVIIFFGVWHTKIRVNNEIERYINDDLNFHEEELESQLERLIEMGENPLASDANRGHVYERMGNICRWQGDELGYYTNLGYAIYFLEMSKDYTTLVNLKLDIANGYLVNNEIKQSEEIISEMEQIVEEHPEAVSNQMISYLERLRAMILYNQGDYERAKALLEDSNNYALQDDFWGPAYFAINNVNMAKIYIQTEEYDRADKCIKIVEDSGYLTVPEFKDIFNRDLCIPYYQYVCEKNTIFGNESEAKDAIVKMVEASEDSDCQVCAIVTLNSLLQYPITDDFTAFINAYAAREYESFSKLIAEDYISLSRSQMTRAQEVMKRERINSLARVRFIILFIVSVLGMLLAIIIIKKIMKANYTDGLTLIGNRKALDRRIKELKKREIAYNFMMIDIDDFKKINDSFGHIMGDEVLIRIGTLLSEKYSNTNLECFRYGGEEFSVLVYNCPKDGAAVIADAIRSAIASMDFVFDERVTVSIGVADTSEGSNVVELADENLYYAKTHGKNQVCAGR